MILSMVQGFNNEQIEEMRSLGIDLTPYADGALPIVLMYNGDPLLLNPVGNETAEEHARIMAAEAVRIVEELKYINPITHIVIPYINPEYTVFLIVALVKARIFINILISSGTYRISGDAQSNGSVVVSPSWYHKRFISVNTSEVLIDN